MLSLKRIKYAFWLLVLTGFVFQGAGDPCAGQQLPSTPSAAAVGGADGHVKAYYFHGNVRCTSCKKIEQYSRRAVETYFGNQLKNKTLIFESINTDKSENKHFIQDFQLITKSLVLVEYKNGKQVQWKNLDLVWKYLNDEEAFLTYVKTETEKYLKDL